MLHIGQENSKKRFLQNAMSDFVGGCEAGGRLSRKAAFLVGPRAKVA